MVPMNEHGANRFAIIAHENNALPRGDPPSDVLAQLRYLIGQAGARPDEPLPTERELAGRFGVSRRMLRRALSILETEGRIWRRQGKGTFTGPAAPPPTAGLSRLSSRTNFFEVMEVRLRIEPSLAQLAALRASGEQVAMLRRLVARMRPSSDADELELWDSAFHRCIAEAAGNRLFLDLFEVVDAIRRDEAWRMYREQARTPERLNLYLAQHDELAEAIAARDTAEAGKIMRRHITAVQQALADATARELDDAV
jgi:GntR family transcriptional regulator, transcriptional repressor for pyruvate dehydrogenase complex